MKSENTAKKLIPLIDLTRLNDQDTPQTIETLCHKAKTPYGFIAAVCIHPQFVKLTYKLLMNTPVKVATVANFPKGNQLITDCIETIKQSIADGADEIDVVMPYATYLEGNTDRVKKFLQVCRSICAPPTVLKVIIETGALMNHDIIFSATNLAIQTGADFIKTSTGKITTGATLEAVELILEAIKNYLEKKIGLKISGGVRTIEQALAYFQLVEKNMGKEWISPNTVRFGASRLLDEILTVDLK